MPLRLVLAILFTIPLLASGASAQEGLATSSSVAGHNTIQQAPSGGATAGNPGAGMANRSVQGQPTARERKLEQRNDAATQICKGC